MKPPRGAVYAGVALLGLLAPPQVSSAQEGTGAGEPPAESKSRAASAHFAGVPLSKPTDRPLSAAMGRLYDDWGPLGDYGNEFYTLFKYSPVTAIGKDADVSRRDPSKVVKVGDAYYVWYTRRKTEHPPVGLQNYSDDTPDDVPAWDWDLADIYYATSKDGFHWEEQGVAVARNIGGDYANRSLSTPDVLCVNGKYHLYYQAFTGRMSHKKGDRCDVSMAWADSPHGPWHKLNRPIIELSKAGEWDSGSIHDPYPVVYKGQIWLYYKSDVWLQDAGGAPVDRLDGTPAYMGRSYHRMHGVAVADRPEGPFAKSPLNPIANSGHETCLFPYKEGMVSLIIKDGPEKNTVQYAADGLNFEVKATVVQPPVAAGPYCPDAFAGNGDGRGICWGLSHVVGFGGPGFLVRFDCDLHRDVDRPPMKHGTIQADEASHFQPRTTLPHALRRQFMQEAASSHEETAQTAAPGANDRLGEVITIAAGPFPMGNNGNEPFSPDAELPQHVVDLPTYEIGKYEVTRGEYRRFIEAGGYEDLGYWSAEGWKWKERVGRTQPARWAAEQAWVGHGFGPHRFTQTDRHPVVGVTCHEAEAYCKWAGGRLPTEAEWEKASRWTGANANVFPWGDDWDAEKCNNLHDTNPAGGGFERLQSAPVGSYPAGASPYGCMDMVGNAYEWVADWYKSYPGARRPVDHTGERRFPRGGCWDDGLNNNRCAYRGWSLPPDRSGPDPEKDCDFIGFRVAR